MSHALFETSIGVCGVAWTKNGISCLQLPEKTTRLTEKKLRAQAGIESDISPPPSRVLAAMKKICNHLSGKKTDLASIEIDLARIPKFHARVYQALRKLASGKVKTYGEMARALGSPRSARAVGQALARNPFPVIVPCHRIVASGNRLGGFSAYGALETKAKLLAIEGVAFSPAKRNGSNKKKVDAVSALMNADATLAGLIRKVGPLRLKPDRRQNPFHALLESILYQQITGKAAQTIMNRLKEKFPHKGLPSPEELLTLSDEDLRGCGLSRNKAAAVRDLARKTLNGVIPSSKEIAKMKDDEIVERLTSVRGIGRWTVEMFLIFNLGRTDVLPLTDYGIRKGFTLTYGLKELPTPKQLSAYGECWRPYRTAASWYLWRSLELKS